MTKTVKIVFASVLGTLMLGLIVWIMALTKRLNAVDYEKEKYWRDQYESAQDSIDVMKEEREYLRNERDFIARERIYWQQQYEMKDSLLNRVKTEYNEKVGDIRDADNLELNGMLSDRLSKIRNNRR